MGIADHPRAGFDLVARQRTEGAVIEAGDAPHRGKNSADIWGRMTSVR